MYKVKAGTALISVPFEGKISHNRLKFGYIFYFAFCGPSVPDLHFPVVMCYEYFELFVLLLRCIAVYVAFNSLLPKNIAHSCHA